LDYGIEYKLTEEELNEIPSIRKLYLKWDKKGFKGFRYYPWAFSSFWFPCNRTP
jgi:hypothetical protein